MLRRFVRGLSLALFLWLLWSAAHPLPDGPLPADAFLRLDPLVAAAVPLAAREWIPRLVPGLLLLLLTLLVGRVFCGYLCPMGTTLDIARRLFARTGKTGNQPALPTGLRRLKYLLLAAALGSALAGVSLYFWLAPIPLITRFYSLLLHPLLLLGTDLGLASARPLVALLDVPALDYLQVAQRRYDSVYFLLAFFAALFLLERVRPRFWCRYLCPAGALFGLFSFRPLWRRKVHACVHCAACVRLCPTAAPPPRGDSTEHRECLVCRSCTDVCPVDGVRFFGKTPEAARTPSDSDAKEETPALPEASSVTADNALAASGELPPREVGPRRAARAVTTGEDDPALPSRRAFLAATGVGVGLAAVGHIGLRSLVGGEDRGAVWAPECIRPPGALPEAAFLDRCLRCGACMKVCPTNGLQPTWLAAGVEGMFSPVLVSRRGPCEPNCNACGQICPSGAVSPLPLEEKQWAKMGTAVVRPDSCLAWAEARRCVVCEEVCPYGAIACEQRPGAVVPVPVVRAERCFGCGYCEHYCPVRIPAIVVLPLNTLRLESGSYRAAAADAGLSLIPTVSGAGKEYPDPPDEALPDEALPPGFSE